MNIQTPIQVEAPRAPKQMNELGLSQTFIRDHALKTALRLSVDSANRLARALAVLLPIGNEVVELLRSENLVENMGEIRTQYGIEIRLALTQRGRQQAEIALSQSEAYGALPVPLDDYRKQIDRQLIKNIQISPPELDRAFENLIINPMVPQKLGPAVNSGRSILLYGAPGNGKTSLINCIADTVRSDIFVPRFVEIAGQVISVYDDSVHGNPIIPEDDPTSLRSSTGSFDQRYYRCRRPVVITGGELKLAQLELNYNPVTKVYQAPLQFKAMSGIFVVDDLGRQTEPPQDLINRWIVPMEEQKDVLTLSSGEKVSVPFDTLVMFSTNFHPKELFDGAALRRIQYKIKINSPSRDELLQVFLLVSKAKGIDLPEEVLIRLFTERYPEIDNKYANFHAIFFMNQIQAMKKFRPDATVDEAMIDAAWENLFVEEELD
ncbi:MAG: ATPase [Pseudomonadota bacterium]